MISSTKQIFCALCCAVVFFRTAFSAPLQEEALVAVATNFVEVAEVLVDAFESRSEHAVSLVAGSTGKLYSQVVNGAPFDLLLAADQVRPQRLLDSRIAVAGSQQTYATGRLTLWSPDPDAIATDGTDVLEQGEFRSLAIANPALAPYGGAAKETLTNLGLWKKLETKIVMGENVGQAHAMVSTQNAELGLIALSYIVSPRNRQEGSRWDVPAELHKPIKQDVVLLQHGAANAAARAFLEFLLSEPARATIRSFGYDAE